MKVYVYYVHVSIISGGGGQTLLTPPSALVIDVRLVVMKNGGKWHDYLNPASIHLEVADRVICPKVLQFSMYVVVHP